MSWMEQLYKTYENNIGKHTQDKVALAPLAHKYRDVQFEILLDEDGNFCDAYIVDKKSASTLIPGTEDAFTRTSKKKAPCALSDELSYIAGDFSNYCQEAKKKSAEEKYYIYMKQLKAWNESEYTHPKLAVIYRYLNKKRLISDLIQKGYITLTNENILDDKKISGKSYEKLIVRFHILSEKNALNGNTWEDLTLINAYTEYFLSIQSGKKDICYFTGREQVRSEKHPGSIVLTDTTAKLISTNASINDTKGFIYRGRFRNAGEAYSLSYEASQKIHSALTWLVKEQGVTIGNKDKRTFVCWNPEGRKTPDILNPFGLYEDDEDYSGNPDVLYKKRLIKTFQGYSNQFNDADNVIVMGLEAATKGRLSITYYNELLASDFLNRIMYWGETCNWFYSIYTEQKNPYYNIETPNFRKIIEYTYGQEQKQKQKRIIKLNDDILKEQMQRLVKCMLDKQPIPKDIVNALVYHSSKLVTYSSECNNEHPISNRENLLSTTCAVIMKYYRDKGIMEGEKDEMKLNHENRDRSYLFGRLLAVFEKVERSTYEKGEKREPNAIRLQSAYVNHPLKTWKILEDALKPYFQKLNPGSREYYKRLISEITEQFCEEDSTLLNQELKETYLLGYYLQRSELNKKKDEQKEETINE